MSRPTRWSVVCALFVGACLVLAFACATGGSDNNSDDASTQPMDASVNVKMDSTVSTADAPKDAPPPPPPQDAPPPPPPQDAPSGPFCTANNQCTVAGQCCLIIEGNGICLPGTIVFDICFPIT